MFKFSSKLYGSTILLRSCYQIVELIGIGETPGTPLINCGIQTSERYNGIHSTERPGLAEDD